MELKAYNFALLLELRMWTHSQCMSGREQLQMAEGSGRGAADANSQNETPYVSSGVEEVRIGVWEAS